MIPLPDLPAQQEGRALGLQGSCYVAHCVRRVQYRV
jgi:hypothetical protein